MKKSSLIPFAIIMLILVLTGCKKSGSERRHNEPRTLRLISIKASRAPVLDGADNDDAWKKAKPIRTIDKNTKTEISVKSAYTETDVYFAVTYDDKEENKKLKSRVWDISNKKFVSGDYNADVFVFKWALDPHYDDLTIEADHSYEADVWFWREGSVSTAEYAGAIGTDKNEDQGSYNAVYEATVNENGDGMAPAVFKPKESIDDVKSAGKWNKDKWTIEFQRRLDTGHKDSVMFYKDRTYFFGVSCFEIPGKEPNPVSGQQIFDYGDVFDKIYLQFK